VIEVWPGARRFEGGAEGVATLHAFSFGGHYDPGNVGFGLLSACNEEALEVGAGFAEHPHRDTEIVTWVLDGELEHRDAEGNSALLGAGGLQVLSAAGGVRHSERNAGPGPLRFLQMWLHPDAYGGTPRYTAMPAPLPPGPGLRVLATGAEPAAPATAAPGAPALLRQRAATLHGARPDTASDTALPDAPYLYVHLARGALTLVEGARTAALGAGDAARVTDARGVRARTEGPAEYLVWEMHARPSYG
jgi:redox-sensitive bicupin YhaK (pirin superfamily)